MAAKPVSGARTALIAAVAVAAGALAAPAAAAGPLPGSAAPAVSASAVSASAASAESGRDHSATQRAIEQVVRDGAPGVVAQSRDSRGEWRGTAGVGDLRTGKKRLPQDRFRIGSITKTFVATVLLQLEAEGRLDLDDTVHEWLPGTVSGNGHDGRKVTLRRLLNHTSGIFNYTSDRGFAEKVFLEAGFLAHRYDSWQPERLVRIAMNHRPAFEPGAKWSYSNTNYILAGMVIEKATGRSYESEIDRRIIRPLRLTATSVPRHDPRVPGPSSRAYSKLSEDPAAAKIHDVTELNPSIAGAAGAMISDARDLQRFHTALFRGRLLPKAQLRAMTSTIPLNPQDPGQGEYGLGMMKMKLACGKEVWGHGGGIHGSNSLSVTTRDASHTLALNTNGDWAGDTDPVLAAEFCG
ncbi:serine hydrolase domain-containing protein [Streptomyces sp. CAU 1734]|uniref:serine hydrolase domain-containing protein n=1 Tax=Streptomyces sp. CAU 1734 TaxID=3140360 RepID=UPI0032613F92